MFLLRICFSPRGRRSLSFHKQDQCAFHHDVALFTSSRKYRRKKDEVQLLWPGTEVLGLVPFDFRFQFQQPILNGDKLSLSLPELLLL
jgi:hypothetical protein